MIQLYLCDMVVIGKATQIDSHKYTVIFSKQQAALYTTKSKGLDYQKLTNEQVKTMCFFSKSHISTLLTYCEASENDHRLVKNVKQTLYSNEEKIFITLVYIRVHSLHLCYRICLFSLFLFPPTQTYITFKKTKKMHFVKIVKKVLFLF